MDKKKIIIFTGIIVSILVITLGFAYAAISFNETKGNSQLVLGDIWMHYNENNQLVLSDAMPMDINDYTTYKVNPVMKSQEVVDNELLACISFLNDTEMPLSSGTMEEFCKGTGKANGYTFQENLDNGDWFKESHIQEMLKLNIIKSNENGTYIVNPIIATQKSGDNELNRCIRLFLSETFDDGSDAESFCKGIGTKNGMNIQEELADWISRSEAEGGGIEEDFLNNRGKELLDAGVIVLKIENLPYFEFTIDGKNTYDKKDIWYEIVLNHDDEHETRTTRIRDDLLRFTLVEVVNGNENILFNNRKYTDLTNKRIHVDTIPANTTEEINKTYRLYMWISEDTVIGNVNEDYTIEEWNNVYASIKVNVTGDFNEKVLETPGNCFTYEMSSRSSNYIINPVMATQEVIDNGLTRCVSLLSGYIQTLSPASTTKDFCMGTGVTYDNKTFQDNLNSGYLFNRDDLGVLEEQEIILKNDSGSFVINPIMASQTTNELSACVFLYEWWGYEFDEGSDAESYCRGTGTAYDGMTLEEELVLMQEGDDFMENGGEKLLYAGVIIPENNEILLTSYDASCGPNVVIPREIDGHPISEIINDTRFPREGIYSIFSHGAVTNVVMLDNITTIGYGAFSRTYLESVTIPSSVTTIGDHAFANSILKSVIIPNSVTTIGSRAFSDNRLATVIIPNSVITIGHNAFSDNQLTTLLFENDSKVNKICNYAFSNNQLTSVEIPDSVKEIESNVFEDNQLETVTLGSGINYVDDSAFEKSSTSNPNLESITFTNKTCEEIKNIVAYERSSEKYFPWLYWNEPYYREGYKASIYGTDGECSY